MLNSSHVNVYSVHVWLQGHLSSPCSVWNYNNNVWHHNGGAWEKHTPCMMQFRVLLPCVHVMALSCMMRIVCVMFTCAQPSISHEFAPHVFNNELYGCCVANTLTLWPPPHYTENSGFMLNAFQGTLDLIKRIQKHTSSYPSSPHNSHRHLSASQCILVCMHIICRFWTR